MRVVFVSGPYRSDSEYGVHQNIQRAEQLALEVWRLGVACICPQKNTAYFGGVLPDSTWLGGDLELVRRSDAVIMIPGWEASTGARHERTLAESLGIPVFTDIEELRKWCNSKKA